MLAASQQPATSNQQPATSNLQPATCLPFLGSLPVAAPRESDAVGCCCRYAAGTEKGFSPSSSNKSMQRIYSTVLYSVCYRGRDGGSGAHNGLHSGAFHRCTRRRLRARFRLALPLSRSSKSDSVVPVRHQIMAISQPMGTSGSQTRRLTTTHTQLKTHTLTESQPQAPSTAFCLVTGSVAWPQPHSRVPDRLSKSKSPPNLQGLVLKRTSVELALTYHPLQSRCMWLLLFENRDGWNLTTCTNGQNPEDLERLRLHERGADAEARQEAIRYSCIYSPSLLHHRWFDRASTPRRSHPVSTLYSGLELFGRTCYK
jgi:hypothetical protein